MNLIIVACLCTWSLVCIELPSRELDLFTRLVGGHAQIRAACTAKGITKVTLQIQEKVNTALITGMGTYNTLGVQTQLLYCTYITQPSNKTIGGGGGEGVLLVPICLPTSVLVQAFDM